MSPHNYTMLEESPHFRQPNCAAMSLSSSLSPGLRDQNLRPEGWFCLCSGWSEINHQQHPEQHVRTAINLRAALRRHFTCDNSPLHLTTGDNPRSQLAQVGSFGDQNPPPPRSGSQLYQWPWISSLDTTTATGHLAQVQTF